MTSSVATSEKENGKVFRLPTIVPWLDNIALRDMQLHKQHSACVDAKGDVYQWGDGVFGSVVQGVAGPIPTLRGKVSVSGSCDLGNFPLTQYFSQNIVKLQLTESKVYALSSSGAVYVLAADALSQEILLSGPQSTGSWTNWLREGKKTIQYEELSPQQGLGWSERYCFPPQS